MNRFSLIQRLRNKIKIDRSSTISLGNNLKISSCKIIIKGNHNRLIIADNVRLRDAFIQIIGNDCSLEIGSSTSIGRGSYLSSREQNTMLKIGEGCALSRNVKIMTSDGHPIFIKNRRINPAKNIEIEKNTWIADNVTILKGVRIGNGSVIGINSTVVKDIPSNSVAVGNPCKVVKADITWKDKFNAD